MPFWYFCQKHSPVTACPEHSRTGSNWLKASHQYSTIAETPPLASGLISHTVQDSPAYIQITSLNCPSISVFTQNPTRTLRLSSAHRLITPLVRTCFGSRGFRVAGPSIWNSLPCAVKSSTSIYSFKNN